MPYDPTPVGGSRESLSVFVEGGRGEPDRTFRLGRPRDGVVDVLETVGAEAPRAYAERADALLARFERAHHERRRTSAELYLIREWLAGRT
jgi:hypothetical protein